MPRNHSPIWSKMEGMKSGWELIMFVLEGGVEENIGRPADRRDDERSVKSTDYSTLGTQIFARTVLKIHYCP